MGTENFKRIAIVGPESTGKSELSVTLAKHYNTVWVREYAREYLEKINREYVFVDLKEIAKGQMQFESEAEKKANRILFCDTNLLVLKVWSEFKFKICDAWILKEMNKRKYDLHLLTNIDLPWQPDPLREHPNERKKLFEIYLKELTQQQIKFEIVSGIGQARFQNAVKLIDNFY